MPTIFSHAAFGFGATKLATGDASTHARLLIASSVLAALPDADGIFFGRIPYGSMLGHRGLTHSLLFAAVIGTATAFLFTRLNWATGWPFSRLALLFSLVMASHGFFDSLTDGGMGVAFFAPFDSTRYFLPWRPIPVAPMSAGGLMSARGERLLLWEAALFWSFAVGAALWTRQTMWRMVASVACWVFTLVAWVVAFSRNS